MRVKKRQIKNKPEITGDARSECDRTSWIVSMKGCEGSGQFLRKCSRNSSINQLLVTGNTDCWIKVQGRQKPGFDLVCSYAKTEGKIKPTAKGTKCVIVKIFHIFNTLKYPVNCVNIFYNCITLKDKLVEYNKMLRKFSEHVVGIEKWKVVLEELPHNMDIYFLCLTNRIWRQEYFVK